MSGCILGRRRVHTSVVSVEKSTLLVPLSKMTVRVVWSSVVVFPLTVIPGDGSRQVPLAGFGSDAKTRSPAENEHNPRTSIVYL